MLAARDQENFAHVQQSAAAAKSLNHSQGSRALHPKTPANVKTPFRSGLNDENRHVDFKGQKAGGASGGGGAAASKLDKSLFVTPGPRRDRAPLGQKTTNAKAAAFKTPAPFKQLNNPNQTIKRPSTARRSARSKIHVATEPLPGPLAIDEELASDAEPDYGYAPPKVADMADAPLEITYDQTFAQFRGKNMFKGYGQTYCTSPTDADGVSIREKEEKQRAMRFEAARLKEADQAAAEALKPVLPTDEELDGQVDRMIASVRPKSRAKVPARIGTVQARSAAAVLSGYASTTTTTTTTIPTRPKLPAAATKQTAASALKRQEPAAAPSQAARPPINVSKNTIGFPKAKPAPRIVPSKSAQAPKIDQDSIHPKDFVRMYGQPPVGSRMHERLLRHRLLEEEVGLAGQRQDGAERAATQPAAASPLFDDDVDELLRGDFAADDGEDGVFQLEIFT